MSRPTKEEAQEWWDMAARAPGSGLALTPLQTACLAAWLWRVRAALPSAAAVQRDRERRKAAAPSHPEGCSCGDPDCSENPYRPQ